jgi:hypothetical protein
VALKQADIEPEPREVYFFDTADLTLFEAGVVLSRAFDTEREQQTKTRTALEYFTGKSLG